MKSSMAVLLLALTVVSPSMAADLKDDLVAMEKSGWEAWSKRDAKAYGDLMTDDAVSASVGAAGGEVTKGREKLLAGVSSHTCTLKSFDFADTNLRQLSPDIAILSYNVTQDVTCEGQKSPAKIFATTIYVRQGGKWRWTSYQETVLK